MYAGGRCSGAVGSVTRVFWRLDTSERVERIIENILISQIVFHWNILRLFFDFVVCVFFFAAVSDTLNLLMTVSRLGHLQGRIFHKRDVTLS